MTRDDIIRAVNSSSLDSFIPVSGITTEARLEELMAQGAIIGYTAQQIQAALPSVDVKYLMVTLNSFGNTYYYDEPNDILFPIMPLFQGALDTDESKKRNGEMLRKTLKDYMELKEQNKWAMMMARLEGNLRLEFAEKTFKKYCDKMQDPYDQLISVYQMTDYGASSLSLNTFKLAASRRTPEEIREMGKIMGAFADDYITIYRGGSDASASWEKGFSWSTAKKVALFFALRHGTKGTYLMKGKIKKADIIAITDDNEFEVIVDPSKVYDAQSAFSFYDVEFLNKFTGTNAMNTFVMTRAAVLNRIKIDGQKAAHNAEHSNRVMLLCSLLGFLYGLSNDDVARLCIAGAFHDCSRATEDVEPGHGAASADRYMKFNMSRLYLPSESDPDKAVASSVKSKDRIVELLIRYHDLPDAEGYAAIKSLPDAQREQAKQLLEIFKDADALDRVRLGLRDGLDIDLLRTDEAKKLPLVAYLALQSLRWNG